MNPTIPFCAAVLAATTVLAGCGGSGRFTDMARLPAIGVYKVQIDQGNIMTPEMLASLRRGMERRHVKVLVGTPTIADPFHADRWDYPYSIEKDEQRQMRRVSLHFVDDRLDRISGDVVGSYALPEIDEFAAKTTVSVPPRSVPAERSWMSRLIPGGRAAAPATTVASFTGDTDEPSTPQKQHQQQEEDTEPGIDEDPEAGLFDGLLDRVGG